MSPRFQIHENGNGTISGVHFTDLEDILTAALLWKAGHPFHPAGVDPAFDRHGQEWERRQKWVIHKLRDALLRSLQEIVPPEPLPLKQRLQAAGQERRRIQEFLEAERNAQLRGQI